MIFGVSPTKDAVVIAQSTGSRGALSIKSIRAIQFGARSGSDLNQLLQRLVVVFERGGKAASLDDRPLGIVVRPVQVRRGRD